MRDYESGLAALKAERLRLLKELSALQGRMKRLNIERNRLNQAHKKMDKLLEGVSEPKA